jgi:hypothetical protein
MNIETIHCNLEDQEQAKKQLINILRRKTTLLTYYQVNRELKEYQTLDSLVPIPLGFTQEMRIKLAFRKYKQ